VASFSFMLVIFLLCQTFVILEELQDKIFYFNIHYVIFMCIDTQESKLLGNFMLLPFILHMVLDLKLPFHYHL
jgi:hypothetical protein